MDHTLYNSTNYSKYTSTKHAQMNSINYSMYDINITTYHRMFSPPNPLIQRKSIPINPPKFGRDLQYITLPPYSKCEYDEAQYEFEIKTKEVVKCQDKESPIEVYINSNKMTQSIVFNKNSTGDIREKITIENIVNLKQKKKKKSKKIAMSANDNDTIIDENTLQFESRFESGNLQLAYKIDDSLYQLFLHNDTNTTGYTQWFYFQVSNTKKRRVKFQIMNLLRKRTKYCYGITIWVFSTKKSKEGVDWYHTEKNTVNYYRNNLYRLHKGKRLFFSTLEFEYDFEDDDIVYFANCIPFTYTDQQRYLNEYQKHENTKYPFFTRKVLCSTLAGNDVDYVIINSTTTARNDSEKEGVVFFARQHPSETVGSFVMKGAIDFLMGNSDEANYLREHFIFKIIPMMNPDGVINGNTRTSFAGCDLNRRWLKPNESIHPEVYNTKEMITKFANQRKIQCIVDFHGHFGAFDSFFYANHDKENFAFCKFFPFLISKKAKCVRFDKCKFSMPKMKNGTGRVDLFRELNIENVFTLETSNFGASTGEYANKYFNAKSLLEIGRDVCLGVLMMHYHQRSKMGIDIRKSLINMSEIRGIENEFDLYCARGKGMKEESEEEEKKEEELKEGDNEEKKNEENNDEEDEDELDSESEPSLDNIDIEEIKQLIPLERRKVKKSKKNKNLKKIRLYQYNNNNNQNTINNNSNNSIVTNSRRQMNEITSNTISNNILNKTQLNLPQLKPISQTPQLKQTQNIVSNMKTSSILQPINQKQNDNKTINESSILKTECDVKKSDNTSLIVPNSLSPASGIIVNGVLKVSSETQTEEIYFKMHWSYFLGSCPILTAKIDIVNNSNNKTSIIAKSTMNNFYMQNFSNYNKKKMKTTRRDINIANIGSNLITTKGNRRAQLDINLNFYSLANGSILINKVSNSHSTKNGRIISKNGLLKSFNFATTNYNRMINQK